MTMHEQELTLFGGWAKAQIRPPIEVGVHRPLDTLSASIYPKPKAVYHEEPIEFDTWEYAQAFWLYRPSTIKVESNVSVAAIEIREYYIPWIISPIDGRSVRSGESYHVLDFTKPEQIVVEGRKEKDFSNWGKWIYGFFLNRTFFRFFEIWERGSLADMIRGCAGTEKTRRSFNGMIGANNNTMPDKVKRPLARREDGDWELSKARELYPDVKRLPKEGIENARKLARAMREKRRASK